MQYFVSALNDRTNLTFACIMILIVITGFLLLISKKQLQFQAIIPSLLVSIGLLGTFWGIFIGLAEFDSQQISESIPKLLDGMKTAFHTSLVGMSLSLLMKTIHSVSLNASPDTDTPDDPILHLASIKKSIEELNLTITKCLKSDEEYSLTSQVKLIRQEIIDSRREVKAEFSKFAEYFSKMASESLVSELKAVVDKFNAMLSDLVSETFRSLKQSTDNLISWQSEYKEEVHSNNESLKTILADISAIIPKLTQAADGINNLAEHMENIKDALESIALSGSELEAASNELKNQNEILKISIEAIKIAGEQAATVVPNLQEKMEGLISDMKSMQLRTNDFVNDTTQDMKIQSENISKLLDERIEAIDKALENELNAALKTFAGAMVALSNQFTSDYMPLTARLRALIGMAENIQRNVQQDKTR